MSPILGSIGGLAARAYGLISYVKAIIPGSLWSSHSGSFSTSWYSAAASGTGQFVATIFNSGTMQYSSDGYSWSNKSMPSSAYWTDPVWNGSKWIVVTQGQSKYATSTDGQTWTGGTTPSISAQHLAYGGGNFFACNYGGNTMMLSSSGTSWTTYSMPTTANWAGVAYGNGTYVCVTDATAPGGAYSTNGTTWSSSSGRSGSAYNSGVAFSNGIFVSIIGTGPTYYTTTDGITWTSRTFPVSYSYGSLQATANNFVMILGGGSANAYYSSDGITWTSAALGATYAGIAIEWDGSKVYYQINNGTAILTSP